MDFKMNFIGIGSGKCGSTWLYQNLVKHPQICDRNLKELNYFSDLYEAHPLSWYESQFAGCPADNLRGEFSVTYLSHPMAAQRIHQDFPDAKLLAIVRNPVKRAYSNYLHSIRKGDIPANLPFNEYINDEKRLIPGQYAQHLERFYAHFDPEQIKVIVTEHFSKDPLAGYQDIYRYIGVNNPEFVPPNYNQKQNVAKSYRFLWLENLLVRSYRGLSKRGYTRLVKHITESGVADRLRMLNSDKRPVPKIDQESKERLLAYYRPFNQELEQLIGKDLSSWESLT